MFPGTWFCTQPLYFVNYIVRRKVLPCSRLPSEESPLRPVSRLLHLVSSYPACLVSSLPRRLAARSCWLHLVSSRPACLVSSRSACLAVSPHGLVCSVSSRLALPASLSRRPVLSAPPGLVSLCLSRHLVLPSLLRHYHLSVPCHYRSHHIVA